MNRLKLAVTGSLPMLLCSCILLPIPWKESPPRYSEPQLAALEEGTTTRDEILASLGNPNLRRAQDRVWIYSWSRDKGKWVALPLVPVWGGVLSPVTSKPYVLFLEFDASGVLRRENFAQLVEDSNDYRLCTARGLCVEHQVVVATDAMTGENYLDFSDTWSAVTAVGEAKDEFEWPSPGQDECLAVLWINQEWRNRGVGIGFDDLSESATPPWVPKGAFAMFRLTAGEHTVFLHPFESSPAGYERLVGRATLQCHPGEEQFLQISKALDEDPEASAPARHLTDKNPIVLELIDPQAARAQLETMPRVLMKIDRLGGNAASSPMP